MFAMKRILRSLAILSSFLSLSLAASDEEYDPSSYNPSTNYRPRNVTGLGDFYSWVGSYYNATAEVELEPIFGWQYGEPLCSKLENKTFTTKFDAVLSVLERGLWNNGSNSVIFWLTLTPQTSPPFNLSSLNYANLWDRTQRELGFSSPIYSVSTYDQGRWLPRNKSSPDLFNFTTSQVPGGAYNLTGTVPSRPKHGNPSYYWSNFSMPICDATKETGETQIAMTINPEWWTVEGWEDFQRAQVSVQFDDKTANLTLEGSFHAGPIVFHNQTSAANSSQGYLRVRFSGALDAYHSDTLSLNDSTPTWLRTVGFGNDSSNIGYSESSVGKLSFGLASTLIAAFISVAVVYS